MTIGDKVIFKGSRYIVEDIIIIEKIRHIQIANKTHRARVTEEFLEKDQ